MIALIYHSPANTRIFRKYEPWNLLQCGFEIIGHLTFNNLCPVKPKTSGEAAGHFELEDAKPMFRQTSPLEYPEACITVCAAFVRNPLHSNGDSCH